MNDTPAKDPEAVLERYGDMLYRTCFVMLGNPADAEDAVQDTLVKYIRKAPDFVTAQYQKAWLLKVAANTCRDILRFRRRYVQLDETFLRAAVREEAELAVLEALLQIPEKYRLVLTLHYVEGYTTEEIARIIGRSQSAVKMRLHRGRQLLKEAYGKE